MAIKIQVVVSLYLENEMYTLQLLSR